MPKKFRSTQPDGTKFECQLECATCSQPTKSGGRCRLRACHGMPMCWMHARKAFKIRAATSLIPNAGRGLFAHDTTAKPNDVVFKKGQYMFPYVGEIMGPEGIDARYGDGSDSTAVYGICDRKQCIDAACVRGWASYINHQPLKRANANYSYRPSLNEFWIKATKNIRNGAEIYCFYGRTYGFQTQHVTK
jgi:hypothetical protein